MANLIPLPDTMVPLRDIFTQTLTNKTLLAALPAKRSQMKSLATFAKLFTKQTFQNLVIPSQMSPVGAYGAVPRPFPNVYKHQYATRRLEDDKDSMHYVSGVEIMKQSNLGENWRVLKIQSKRIAEAEGLDVDEDADRNASVKVTQAYEENPVGKDPNKTDLSQCLDHFRALSLFPELTSSKAVRRYNDLNAYGARLTALATSMHPGFALIVPKDLRAS